MSSKDAMTEVHGTVLPGYEGVRSAFEKNLASGMELGAAFAVYRGGVPVVNLWGGRTAETGADAVTERTLFSVNSTTKAVVSICIAMLVEQGKLDYEKPVATYWPEFAAGGKAAITVGEMMSHQAGLVGARATTTREDYMAHDPVASRLAEQEPFFEPGTWGYHALTFGTLADELVRRVDGRTVGRFFADEVASKLGLDVFLGLPLEEDDRYTPMVGEFDSTTQLYDVIDPQSAAAALTNPMVSWSWANDRRWREIGPPGAGACASASGLARLFSLLVCHDLQGTSPLLSRPVLQEATRERVAGMDRCTGGVGRYGAGFRLNTGTMGSNPASFGHLGMGGSVAFADPSRHLGVAYVVNKLMNPDWQAVDPRLAALLRALYLAEAAQASGPQ